ncbi:MAG: SRPBCC family protein [Bacteroidota bacterium]
MKLESNKVSLNKSQKEVFDFLSQVSNFEKIMPESIEKFETLDEESFLFQLKGMPVIKLILKETSEPNEIILGAKSDKLPFTLKADIQKESEDQTVLQLFFEGEFNAMMSMMIKSPIKKFINNLVENMQKQ